jgi:UDP-sugar transporter A1/2/3
MSKQLLSSISLILLTVQNSALSLVVTESRKTEHVYNGATAVFLCELGKVVVCTILLLYSKAREDLKKEAEREDLTEKEELGLVASNSTNDNFFDTSILSEAVKDVFTLDCIRLLVPALLYVLQNNLQLVAATHLSKFENIVESLVIDYRGLHTFDSFVY